jgi:hypothetical protein
MKMGANSVKETEKCSRINVTCYSFTEHGQLSGVFVAQLSWETLVKGERFFCAAFVKDCDGLIRSTLVERECIGSKLRTVASLALHLFINLKYSGMRLRGTLMGASIASRGKTAARTLASTKKSVVKTPKVEVTKDFMIRT